MKNDKLKPISTFPKSRWKIWLWGVILFVAVFIGIKEVSKSNEVLPVKADKKTKETSGLKIDESTSDHIHFYDDDDITLPSFPKGEKAFASYLQKSVHVDAQTKGKAIVSFVVNKNGSLTNIKLLRSINEEVDNEVINVLKRSPKWNPGRKKTNKEAVDVAFTLPVNFDK